MSEAKSNSANNHKINYVEFTSNDVARSKQFYSTAFGWSFQEWVKITSVFKTLEPVSTVVS